ncbi:MAG: mandelate racemase/muconate lactonizing enzyme family protein, partial [Burkholderiales bacterium]
MTRPEDYVRAYSRPSELNITDLRTATVGWDGWRFPLIRIDTNQGLSGYGEVRDGASKTYALLLKNHLLGENPCNVDKVFRKIKQFGHHARQGGGVCAVEMALMDLAGKAYGVPAYALCGGKFRDHIRMYCDTPNEPHGEAMGLKLKERLARGFTMLKMDVGIQPLIGVKDALGYPAGMLPTHDSTALERMLDIQTIQHPFTHVRLTEKGIRMLCEYVEEVRAIVGYEVPIAADHFGHIGIDDCLRLGEALEPYNLAWLEDMVPWQYTEQWVQLERALQTPVCTGEDIYLKESFMPLLQARAVNVVHPDLATSGGILETKKIGDLAQEHGISMA